jgi:hypothetical protein
MLLLEDTGKHRGFRKSGVFQTGASQDRSQQTGTTWPGDGMRKFIVNDVVKQYTYHAGTFSEVAACKKSRREAC